MDEKAQVLTMVCLGAGHTQWRLGYHCSGPAAWLGVNDAGPKASVRIETSGETAQHSRVELFPQVGEAGTDKGKQAFQEVKQQGQNSRPRFAERTRIKG